MTEKIREVVGVCEESNAHEIIKNATEQLKRWQIARQVYPSIQIRMH